MILTIEEMSEQVYDMLLDAVKDLPEENKQRVMTSILDGLNRSMGGPGVSGPEEEE